MGIILPFPATRSSRKNSAEALGEETLGAILFFTGVRYERQIEAGYSDPENEPQNRGSGRGGNGASRKARKKH